MTISCAAQAHVKIATIDQNYIKAQCTQCKRFAVALQAQKKRFDAERTSRARDVQKAQLSYHRNPTDTAEQHYKRLEKSFRKFNAEADRVIKQHRLDDLAILDRHLGIIISNMYKNGNYDLLLTKPSFSISSRKLDITMKALELYNKQYP